MLGSWFIIGTFFPLFGDPSYLDGNHLKVVGSLQTSGGPTVERHKLSSGFSYMTSTCDHGESVGKVLQKYYYCTEMYATKKLQNHPLHVDM